MLILFYFQLMGRVNRIINEYFETKPVLDPASPGITLSSFTRTCSMKKEHERQLGNCGFNKSNKIMIRRHPDTLMS